MSASSVKEGLNSAAGRIRGLSLRSKLIAGSAAVIIAAAGAASYLVVSKGPEQFSKQNPWSVRVSDFRSESDAENAASRLRKMKIPAYVVSRSPAEGDIWHSVQVGAFAEKKQADDEAVKLKTAGLNDSSVSEFSKSEKEIDAYKKTDRKSRTEFSYKDPDIRLLSPAVRETIKRFPVDENFKVVSLSIGDVKNMAEKKYSPGFYINSAYLPPDVYYSNLKSSVSAVTQAVYQDKLFGYKVGVTITDLLKPDEDFAKIFPADKMPKNIIASGLEFGTEHGDITGTLYKLGGAEKKKAADKGAENPKGSYLYVGKFKSSPHLVIFSAPSITEAEFRIFLTRDDEGKGLLVYPEVRSNLSFLPAPFEDKKEMVFLYFTLNRIGWDYAVERSRAWWARMIVGNWNASSLLFWKERPLAVSFFNLNYSSTAAKVHGNFMEQKRSAAQNPFLQSVMRSAGMTSMSQNVHKDLRGWYTNTGEMNELSFSNNSAVIAVDSYSPRIPLDDLLKVTDQLRIW
jgi:hypothetical protein